MRALLPLAVAVLLAAFTAPAQAQSGLETYDYTACAGVGEASIVEVVGASCAEAEAVAAQVVARPADGAAGVLTAANWRPLRAQSIDDGTAYDLVATRPGRAALRIRRPGAAPDLDGWEAGRELLLARRKLVGGKPPPAGAVLCTSSWLVRVGDRIGGLSAAHCGGLRRDRTVHRRNVAMRRAPQPGIVLGRVRRILTRTRPLDALLIPVPSAGNRSHLPVVDRGASRPPWVVAGIAQPTAGRAVCFSGRTSGIDRCGTIQGNRARSAERLLSIFAGVRRALYDDPRARGRQRRAGLQHACARTAACTAIGIVTLVVGDTGADVLHPAGAGARRAVGAARRRDRLTAEVVIRL